MKRTLLFVCLLVFCNLTLLGQTGRIPRIAHTTEKSAIHVPPQEAPAGLKTIFSNLGKSKTDLYNDSSGLSLEGPNAANGAVFVGTAFTPKANSHVSQVRVAVGHLSGANQVNFSLYADLGGAPGTLLAGPVTVTNLPTFGTCCLLAVANFPLVAVTGGTQYWVTADTPLTGTGSDFYGGWYFVAPSVPDTVNTGSGWVQYTFFGGDVAGEVLGTIP